MERVHFSLGLSYFSCLCDSASHSCCQASRGDPISLKYFYSPQTPSLIGPLTYLFPFHSSLFFSGENMPEALSVLSCNLFFQLYISLRKNLQTGLYNISDVNVNRREGNALEKTALKMPTTCTENKKLLSDSSVITQQRDINMHFSEPKLPQNITISTRSQYCCCFSS